MIQAMHEAKLCPLCQKDNKCGLTNNPSAEVCWCFTAGFPKEIFDQLPANREKVCICEKCLKEFNVQHPPTISKRNDMYIDDSSKS